MLFLEFWSSFLDVNRSRPFVTLSTFLTPSRIFISYWVLYKLHGTGCLGRFCHWRTVWITLHPIDYVKCIATCGVLQKTFVNLSKMKPWLWDKGQLWWIVEKSYQTQWPDNKMEFIIDKCEVMLMEKRADKPNLPFKINSQSLWSDGRFQLGKSAPPKCKLAHHWQSQKNC